MVVGGGYHGGDRVHGPPQSRKERGQATAWWLWRNLGFGSMGPLPRSQGPSSILLDPSVATVQGSRFVERIMTVSATCKQQDRSAFEYLNKANLARLHGLPAPSLLPSDGQTT